MENIAQHLQVDVGLLLLFYMSWNLEIIL